MAWEIAKNCYKCNTRIHFSPYDSSVDWASDYKGSDFIIFSKELLQMLDYLRGERASFLSIQIQCKDYFTKEKIRNKWKNINPKNTVKIIQEDDERFIIILERDNECRNQNPS